MLAATMGMAASKSLNFDLPQIQTFDPFRNNDDDPTPFDERKPRSAKGNFEHKIWSYNNILLY
jgi:hypothetical protein